MKPSETDFDDDAEAVSFEAAAVNLDAYYAANPDKRPPEAMVLRELAKMQARTAAQARPAAPIQRDLFA